MKKKFQIKQERIVEPMGYKELIRLMEIGHDIIGETKEGYYFGVLNVEEENCTIIIGNEPNEIEYKIPYGFLEKELETLKIYNNMTYKELLDSEIVLIYEVY